MKTIAMFLTILAATQLCSAYTSQQTFIVMLVPSENGSYTVTPEIPKNGEVPAGTELNFTAKPATLISCNNKDQSRQSAAGTCF